MVCGRYGHYITVNQKGILDFSSIPFYFFTFSPMEKSNNIKERTVENDSWVIFMNTITIEKANDILSKCGIVALQTLHKVRGLVFVMRCGKVVKVETEKTIHTIFFNTRMSSVNKTLGTLTLGDLEKLNDFDLQLFREAVEDLFHNSKLQLSRKGVVGSRLI